MYILDTNAFSDYLRHGQLQPLGRKLESVPNPMVTVHLTIVTVEEVLFGRINAIKRNLPNIVELCRYLSETYDELKKYKILPYTQEAHDIFLTIPKGVRSGRYNDCRIAAIALATDMTVITADVKEGFSKIHDACGVEFEDWSKSSPV